MTTDWLDEVELPRDSVAICIKPALVREHAHLVEELRQAEKADVGRGRSLAPRRGDNALEEMEARRADLEDRMRAATKTFTASAIDRDEYRDLVAKYPARKGSKDEMIGYDVERFTESLVVKCLVDPALDLDGWRKLRARLNAGQVNKIQRLVHSLNGDEIDLPF